MAVDGARRLILIQPRGFCAGVVRAIDAVWMALERFGPPIYVRHEIVHNEHVLRELETAGAVFVEDLDEVPPGSRVFFSAHGVPPSVHADAALRGLDPIDATCPLVTKVHHQAIRLAEQGVTILLIGHPDHVEIAGTLGEAPAATVVVPDVATARTVTVPDPERVGYLTQTTLGADDVAEIVDVLQERFPELRPPASEDLCYATTNRQTAVRAVATRVDAMLVVGSATSSNSRSLVETAQRTGVPAALVPDPEAISWSLIADARRVGLTSGASSPESLFRRVVAVLVGAGFEVGEEVTVLTEDVRFSPPRGLRDTPAANVPGPIGSRH